MNTTEKKQQLAIATFQSGYNCAQSVLSTFSINFSLERDSLLKLASPFGSGIAKTQETCGAVTGALMAIGLKYGKGTNGTEEDKLISYALAQKLMTEFSRIHGCTNCKKLLNDLDMNNESEMAKIKELNLFNTNCINYIQTAVKLTDEILENN
ncbi:C-GCAxxG-C-C family protein [Paludibacter jiangxiensis]|jgi:C_GCAxxG_C_C family probable redox protein|uniref:C_GCAxxG_C_C family probable redox protein n=1 Tax=Paludibacter jiangxiensis TaxID=681398 RepID=A0A161LTG5_9BACT|nr:C-GCAxxG-C-C family protein [Paludibacter jiangxiensis]GAT64260.1 C_GCAxxG_C_C family probable redox protein [Paludibacter jiangxiensis]